MTALTVPSSPPPSEPNEKPVSDLTRGTWIHLVDEDGCDHGEAEVLHVENAGNSAVLLFRSEGGTPRPLYFDDATCEVELLSDERLAEARREADRAKFIAGLREFADWLAANPWAPVQRDSGYFQHARLQIDLHGDDMAATAATVARVREIGDRLGVKVDENLDDRTDASIEIGAVSYSVIAWHRTGRPVDPEPAPPALPEGLDYSREADDPTPVSPARVPLHTGGLVDGGELVDETKPRCYVANGFQAPEVIAEREAACAARHPGRPCTAVSESR